MEFDKFDIDDFKPPEWVRITTISGFERTGYILGWTPEWEYEGEHEAAVDYQDEESGLVGFVSISRIASIETKDRKFVYREP